MNGRLLSTLVPLVLAACAAQGGSWRAAHGERTLAEELNGRVAGEAASCVDLHDVIGTRIVPGGEAILFRGRGGILWVNRPQGGCRAPADVFVRTRSTTGRLCRGEAVALAYPQGRSAGTCILGEFTPYRRAG